MRTPPFSYSRLEPDLRHTGQKKYVSQQWRTCLHCRAVHRNKFPHTHSLFPDEPTNQGVPSSFRGSDFHPLLRANKPVATVSSHTTRSGGQNRLASNRWGKTQHGARTAPLHARGHPEFLWSPLQPFCRVSDVSQDLRQPNCRTRYSKLNGAFVLYFAEASRLPLLWAERVKADTTAELHQENKSTYLSHSGMSDCSTEAQLEPCGTLYRPMHVLQFPQQAQIIGGTRFVLRTPRIRSIYSSSYRRRPLAAWWSRSIRKFESAKQSAMSRHALHPRIIMNQPLLSSQAVAAIITVGIRIFPFPSNQNNAPLDRDRSWLLGQNKYPRNCGVKADLPMMAAHPCRAAPTRRSVVLAVGARGCGRRSSRGWAGCGNGCSLYAS